jgi:hypothetical protein
MLLGSTQAFRRGAGRAPLLGVSGVKRSPGAAVSISGIETLLPGANAQIGRRG